MHLLIQGDARQIPLADQSVHAICTSPPYFGLRDYDHPNQIGLEPNPADFVEAIRTVARELWRVLRDDGSFWLNLGDSFANDTKWGGESSGKNVTSAAGGCVGQKAKRDTGLKPKDLCLIPERVAMALQADGWYVRGKPPWVKPNPMPESTNDRPNVAHESIYLLTKQPRYYFDMEAVRVPSADSTLARDAYSRITQSGNKSHVPGVGDHSGIHKTYAVSHDHETPSDPGGRHLRTNDFFTASLDELIGQHQDYVAHLIKIRDNGGLLHSEEGEPLAFWQATKSFKGAHFATWPGRLVEPMIKASTSERGCCSACGAPWVRVVERVGGPQGDHTKNYQNTMSDQAGRETGRSGRASGTTLSEAYREHGYPEIKTIGWEQSCDCDSFVRPCVILDPFNGAGTTTMTAVALGRHGVGIDLNADYLAMSRKRIERPHAPVKRATTRKPADGEEDSLAKLFGMN